MHPRQAQHSYTSLGLELARGHPREVLAQPRARSTTSRAATARGSPPIHRRAPRRGPRRRARQSRCEARGARRAWHEACDARRACGWAHAARGGRTERGVRPRGGVEPRDGQRQEGEEERRVRGQRVEARAGRLRRVSVPCALRDAQTQQMPEQKICRGPVNMERTARSKAAAKAAGNGSEKGAR